MAEHTALSHEEFGELAAGVAFDAVDVEEVKRVEEHAATCASCARELQDYREIASAIGSAVPQLDPPAVLQGRVMAAARRERQEGPKRRVTPLARVRRLSPAWLVAAASLAFSVAALAWVAVLHNQVVALQADAQASRDRVARYDHVVEVLASDNLAIKTLHPAVQNMGSRGTLYMDPATGTGMVMCHNMPPLEAGHAYQVWFVRGNERISGGMLWPDRDGNGYTMIRVPNDVQSFDSIGLTDEPGSGSAWPTTPRVIGTPLKATDQ
jgi:hypothetical protein